jgi:SAM-dependent MidA family methyltransferase
VNALEQQIKSEIHSRGAVSFARFMELALYCPELGYYEQLERAPGRRGDYFTSVSVGSLFGELLAVQFAEWLRPNGLDLNAHRAAGSPPRLRLVEAGAHDGQLARDILSWLREFQPELLSQLEYWIIEPSARRRTWQQRTLSGFKNQVIWVEQLSHLCAPGPEPPREAIPSPEWRGVIFSNELLDAMPVHRLGWDAKTRTWFEWGITMRDQDFVWTRMPNPVPSDTGIESLDPELKNILPDGFTLELCPAATRWWQEAATLLPSGKLLTVDYGREAEEFFKPEHSQGTLRAYHAHQYSADVLPQPGTQDLTADVNFTAIRQAGETAGLETEVWSSQARFLTGIAARIWMGTVRFGEWTPARTRQFQTLTHPEHLGRPFRVLVQSREMNVPPPLL